MRFLKALGMVCVILLLMVGILFGLKTFWWNRDSENTNLDESEQLEQEIKKADIDALTDLSYGEAERNIYDLYIPANASTEKVANVMLFIHGGAWTSGDKQWLSRQCVTMAKKGYVTATMNYSYLANEGTVVTAFTMLDEIDACISSINTQLLEQGITVNGIALSGQSAGGHLALMYSYTRQRDSAIPVKFAFVQVAPADFHPETWGVGNDMRTILHTNSALAGGISGLSGQTVTVNDLKNGAAEEAIASISPAAQVTAESVPTIIAYGDQDTTVGTKQMNYLIQAFEKFGITYDYIEYPNSGHSLDQDQDCTKKYYKTIVAYAEKYFK